MNDGINIDSKNKIISQVKKNLGNTKSPKLYLYGSRAKGNHRKYSDIDLLIIAVSYDRSSLSKIDFSDLDIPYKVDLVLEPDLFEEYKSEIVSHMILLTEL
jgi:predicted nucleotidyltransferase